MLDLSPEERDTLVDVLRNSLSTLREEVYKTENYEWRQDLKRREAILRSILQRLGEKSEV